jgi:hypothetical protein
LDHFLVVVFTRARKNATFTEFRRNGFPLDGQLINQSTVLIGFMFVFLRAIAIILDHHIRRIVWQVLIDLYQGCLLDIMAWTAMA